MTSLPTGRAPIESPAVWVANDPGFHVEMDFRPGDVQLLNNAVILHAREAYEDHEFTSVDDTLRGGIPRRQT